MSSGEWILIGIWVLSVAVLAGQAWAQSHAQGAVQGVFRDDVRELSQDIKQLNKGLAGLAATVRQIPCVDNKTHVTCPEDKV